MNTSIARKISPEIQRVIGVIENHFDDLCGFRKQEGTEFARGNVPFSISSAQPPQPNANMSGLLRLAMVGSPERTLQGEVFYAIRNIYGNSAVLEMKVSEWHKTRRNIDCVISPEAPKSLNGSIFIELGHYSTIQSSPEKMVLQKITTDFNSSQDLLKNNLGSILHVMFVTHVESFSPQTTCTNEGILDWPRLPGYFVQKWAGTSRLQSSSYKNGKIGKLADIENHLKHNMLKYYIGHVQGCDETVTLGNGILKASGRVDRFYSVSP